MGRLWRISLGETLMWAVTSHSACLCVCPSFWCVCVHVCVHVCIHVCNYVFEYSAVTLFSCKLLSFPCAVWQGVQGHCRCKVWWGEESACTHVGLVRIYIRALTWERLGSLVPACERQICLPCLSHAGTREPNLSHDCASGETLA